MKFFMATKKSPSASPKQVIKKDARLNNVSLKEILKELTNLEDELLHAEIAHDGKGTFNLYYVTTAHQEEE
jgi:hypothetical protein